MENESVRGVPSDSEETEDEKMLATLPRNRMLTLVEAADFLEMHPDTLRQQAGRGVFKAEKVGRDWLVSPLEVVRYARSHRRLSRRDFLPESTMGES